MKSNSQSKNVLANATRDLDQVLDEIADQLLAHGAVDVESYVERYPQWETDIHEAYPGVRAMVELGLAEKQEPEESEHGLAQQGQLLGDFRIVREIGRGGMGIVYEAEQLSLRRRVALKVLPFAGTLDERRLARFKNEAQAAAALKHPNIVSVHFVGSERAVHFYAMELVDGQSLAELQRSQLKSPNTCSVESSRSACKSAETLRGAADNTRRGKSDVERFRWVARVGVQAADALHHAHETGIVHRDIKPSNLLVDSRGHLWVTDFGLAQIQADSDLTLTGDLVGTLRYMSPEQARGDRTAIDRRTDIYSLGATLYQLATGHPPFEENDRQLLLRHIAEREPVNPHTHNTAIPRDLETVILKAMSKEPLQRYRKAVDLASDLKRFLDHRPVHAKRPSFWQRTAMWSKRHPAWVAAVMVVAMLAIIGLSVSTLLISRARDRVMIERNLAREQQQRAEANLRLARETLEELSAEFTASPLVTRQRVATMQREFLEKSLRFYEQLAQANEGSPELEEDQANAHLQIATMANALSEYTPWEESSRKAIEIYQRLAEQFPNRPEYRVNLARSHVLLGYCVESSGRRVEGRDWERRGVRIYERLVKEYPHRDEYAAELSLLLNDLGDILPRDDPEKLRCYQRGLRIARRLQQKRRINPKETIALIWNLKDVGGSLSWEQPDGAREMLREVVTHAENLCSGAPNRSDYRYELALAYDMYARVLVRAADEKASREWFAKSEAIWHELIQHRPEMPDYRKGVANTYLKKSLRAYWRGDISLAESSCRRAIEMLESLIVSIPELVTLRERLIHGYANLGRILTAQGRVTEAKIAFQDAFTCLDEAEKDIPAVDFAPHRARRWLDLAWFHVMVVDAKHRNADEALRLIERWFPSLNRPNAQARTIAGIAHYRNGQWNEAANALDQLPRDEWFDRRVAGLFEAMAKWQLGKHDEARDIYARVLETISSNKPRSFDLEVAIAEARELMTDSTETSRYTNPG